MKAVVNNSVEKMTSNLANIYAELLNKYKDKYMVSYTVAPTYLHKICGPQECCDKIVLFYLQNLNLLDTSDAISPSKISRGKHDSGQLDLTGSPLKDDCLVEAIEDLSLNIQLVTQKPWSRQEASHNGISVEKARSIICSKEFQLQVVSRHLDSAKGSIWFLCNGTDADKTILLQYELHKGMFTRGIVNFLGVVPVHTVNTQSLLRHHNALMPPGTRVETFIENSYEINVNTIVNCSWSTTATVPTLVDLSFCDVTLSQTFHFQQNCPLTQDLMNQLRILMFIREDIAAYKERELSGCSGNEAVYRCGLGIGVDELNECINKIMTETSTAHATESNAVASIAEYDIEAVVQRAKLRRLTDLTDKLWEILKCCSSYADLKLAFNILFKCAAHYNLVNTPTNKNRLAEIITEVANRRLAIPCLTGCEPLELLLEIGLEKLFKDYEYIFTESKICSVNSLKLKSEGTGDVKGNGDIEMPNLRKSLHNVIKSDAVQNRKTLLHNNAKSSIGKFKCDGIGFRNTNYDEDATRECLAKLFQIHCTLEHLLMLHAHLNINTVFSDVCEQLLKKPPPRIVNSIDDNLTDQIEISLSANDVCAHLEGKEPNTRRITMRSMNKFREVKSTFFYSMENVCPPGIAECIPSESDKELTKENTYYSWCYRKIQTMK